MSERQSRGEPTSPRLPADEQTDASESPTSDLSVQDWQVDPIDPSLAQSEPVQAETKAGGTINPPRGELRPDSIPFATAAIEPEVPPSPLAILEAMLFIGGQPLPAERACQIVRGLDADGVREAVENLNQVYRMQNRPYFVASSEAGYTLTVRPRFRSIKEKIFGGPREARLTPAALDVLALVAYRQPATKAEIDSVRGGESGHILRQLVRLGLILVVQRGESKQREVSYGTTARFLELFSLESLDDLPQTGDAQRL